MDATLGFGRGHALHAMGARLELQAREGGCADHPADDFLVTAVFTRALAERLDPPTLALGVARVHAQQVTGEDRGLIAPGTGTDLQIDVADVTRIGGDQHAAQLLLVRLERCDQARGLLGAELAHVGVRIGSERTDRFEFLLMAEESPPKLGQRGQARVFDGGLPELRRPPLERWLGEGAPELFPALGLHLDAVADRILHSGKNGWRGMVARLCVPGPSLTSVSAPVDGSSVI